jgi:hypothetical protein
VVGCAGVGAGDLTCSSLHCWCRVQAAGLLVGFIYALC